MKNIGDVFLQTSLVDFANMIHTEEDCRNFLVEYKWASGYSCNRCNHRGYQERKDRSRTCNKCGYTESPTANTIFHKVKFGLVKAFFIAFEYLRYDRIDIRGVSKVYNVRKSTVDLFCRKLRGLHCLNPACSCH